MNRVVVHFRLRGLAAVLVASCVIVAACSSGSSSRSTSTSRAVGVIMTAVGVGVSGVFGAAPKLTVPATRAPVILTQQTISLGRGARVVKGDTVVVNYVGQTWAPKKGKVDIFDSSFSHGAPAAFVIGEGKVIPGWDKSLVGKKLGSRLILTVPPVDGYGAGGQSSAGITGSDTLVFVVDLIAAYPPSAAAAGIVVAKLPASGLPKITNVAGRKPEIISTAGVKVPTKPVSTLVVTGSGTKIDTGKVLVVQFVQTDLATGRKTQSTWGQGPQTLPAKKVLSIADKLSGQRIGSRVIVLLPATAATPASATQQAQPAVSPQILVIDVVGQY